MALDPVIEVSSDRDAVPVDVLAASSLDSCFIPGRLSLVLAGESADPARSAGACLRILDPDDIAPGAAASHDAITQPGTGHAASASSAAM